MLPTSPSLKDCRDEGYRRVLRPAIEMSGIDWPKGTAFHMFRKTAASLIRGSGKTGRQRADWGHHDPSFSIRTYVGQVDEGLGDASFLDELVPVDDADSQHETPGELQLGAPSSSAIRGHQGPADEQP